MAWAGALCGGPRRGSVFVYAALAVAGGWSLTLQEAEDGRELWRGPAISASASQSQLAALDATPARMLIAPRRNLVPGSLVESNTLRLSGVTVPVGVAADGNTLISVAGGPFRPGPVAVARGEALVFRSAAPAAGQTRTVTITTGTLTSPWTLTALEAVGFTHQTLYGPWGACDAAQPCEGTGQQSREILCLRSDGRFVDVGACAPDLTATQSRRCPSPAGTRACDAPPPGTRGWTQFCAAGSSAPSACTGSGCDAAFQFDGSSCVQKVFAACAADSAAEGWQHPALPHGGIGITATRPTPAAALPGAATAGEDRAAVACDDGIASVGTVTTRASACLPSHRLVDGACVARLGGTGITFASGGSVAEAHAGAPVGQLTNDDPDSAPAEVSYALAAGAGDGDNGLFTVTATGVVQLSPGVALDFEQAARRSLRVEATDGVNRWSAVVTVVVLDVNEPPTAVILSRSSHAIDENTALGAGLEVARILSVSDDALGTVAFGLGGVDAARFALVGDRLMFTGPSPDFEAPADADGDNGYDVVVTVDDPAVGSTPDASADFRLDVRAITEHCEVPRASCAAHAQAGCTRTGRHVIAPVGGGSYTAWCDQETDGGGWMLILNYLHRGGTNPALDASTTALPIQKATALGTDESTDGEAWGHAAPGLLSRFETRELRFECSSSGHGRRIHFASSHPGAVDYLRTGGHAVWGLRREWRGLGGHSANLPAAINAGFSDQAGEAATNFPFYTGGAFHWGIRGGGSRWECDDYPDDQRHHTRHQIWVREVNPSVTSATTSCSVARPTCQAHLNAGCTLSGRYTVTAGGAPTTAQCDMTTDGGGWMLVLNYLHGAGSNPPVVPRSTPPLARTTEPGFGESGLAEAWGHLTPAALNAYAPSQLRFQCRTGVHGRMIHFRTSNASVLSAARTGLGSMTGVSSSPVLLSGHNANLPVSLNAGFSNQGDLTLTNFPFYTGSAYHWGIHGLGNRWECDDYPLDARRALNSIQFATSHQVWSR